MNAFEELTANFSRLPGIGKKSAVRMVNWLLKQDKEYVKKFAANLDSLQDKIKPCSVCGTWTESDPCPICANPLRDKSIVCVVEQPQDVSTIEAYGEFKGQYHVLGGLLKPIEGIGPSQLALPSLVAKVNEGGISEIIIATNPTVEGDTTALYVQKILKEQCQASLKITRLATGIPVGGDLEYIDRRTLSLSFRGRTEF